MEESAALPVTAGDAPIDRPGLVRGWPTGAKIFFILAIVLFPFALIGVFASLKTNQTANDNARAQLHIVASESGRKLAIELIGDMTALRTALNALDADHGDAPSCARAQGIFAQQAASGTRFVVTGAHHRVLCGAAFPAVLPLPEASASVPVAARIVPGAGIALAVTGASGTTSADAFFPTAFLAATGRPSGYAPPYELRLERGDDTLMLTALPPRGALDRRETIVTRLGIGDLALHVSVRSAPITSPLLIAMLLPILMWAAAASLGWLVVDRLLIRPLRLLRTSVAAFTPGTVIDPIAISALPAQEIRELGDTFRAISATVAAHEAGLAEGLVRQTLLTREVHHRVKNNLQVISSLINFHARSAVSRDASEAYASIQRRVDALAVVHRHHFAELEENRGLSLRSVIGELASNIRATAPETTPLSIVIDIDPYLATQDVAIAIAFLITEIVEMTMSAATTAQTRISVKPGDTGERATLRVSSPALIDGDAIHQAIEHRYGRIIEGLARQLRAKLHHDPLVGAYEISVAVTGRD